MNDTPIERLLACNEDGQPVLKLELPKGSSTLTEISQSDEYDYLVPDAEITIQLRAVVRALEVLRANPNIFRHIGIETWVFSEGYEGKLRLEHLNVYAHYNDILNHWHYSFFLFWCNEWTLTEYCLDITRFFYELLGGFDNIVENLAKLEINS